MRATLIRNLFNVLCALSYESLIVEGTQNIADLQKACGEYFEAAYKNYDKTAYGWECIQKHFNVLEPAEDGSRWPFFFREWVHDYLHGKATMEAVSKMSKSHPYKKWEKEAVRLAVVGEKVRTRAVHIKSVVIAFFAQRFIPRHKLPSGKTQEQLFRAIRVAMWPVEAQRRALDSTKTKAKRELGKRNPWTEEQDREWYDSRLVSSFKKLDYTWYPDEWLAFVYYSLPAGNECLNTLDGGKPNNKAKNASSLPLSISASSIPRVLHTDGEVPNQVVLPQEVSQSLFIYLCIYIYCNILLLYMYIYIYYYYY
jgi:hypothetical protein